MSEPDLLYEVKDKIAWMTINRESRSNALSPEMIDLFLEYLDRAEADDNVRGVCITGIGDKVFCSGADLISTIGGEGRTEGIEKFAALLKKFASFSKPLTARVNGHCVAGGIGLILSCDMVYRTGRGQVRDPGSQCGPVSYDDNRADISQREAEKGAGNDLHCQNAFSR